MQTILTLLLFSSLIYFSNSFPQRQWPSNDGNGPGGRVGPLLSQIFDDLKTFRAAAAPQRPPLLFSPFGLRSGGPLPFIFRRPGDRNNVRDEEDDNQNNAGQQPKGNSSPGNQPNTKPPKNTEPENPPDDQQQPERDGQNSNRHRRPQESRHKGVKRPKPNGNPIEEDEMPEPEIASSILPPPSNMHQGKKPNRPSPKAPQNSDTEEDDSQEEEEDDVKAKRQKPNRNSAELEIASSILPPPSNMQQGKNPNRPSPRTPLNPDTEEDDDEEEEEEEESKDKRQKPNRNRNSALEDGEESEPNLASEISPPPQGNKKAKRPQEDDSEAQNPAEDDEDREQPVDNKKNGKQRRQNNRPGGKRKNSNKNRQNGTEEKDAAQPSEENKEDKVSDLTRKIIDVPCTGGIARSGDCRASFD